jgi:hypothetical protein
VTVKYSTCAFSAPMLLPLVEGKISRLLEKDFASSESARRPAS